MVAYKGTRAEHLRQYIKNKPHKWGYKVFVIAGVSGIILDFIPYQGSVTFTELKRTKNHVSAYESSLGVGASVVIALCRSLPDPANSVIYFDNYFSGLPLFHYLKQNMNIRSLGTLCPNRIAGCPIETGKILTKQGRGSFDFKTDVTQGGVIKWVDNKCVLLGSTLYGVNKMSNAVRFSKSAGKRVDVTYPNIVNKYNKHMGGVDKANALVVQDTKQSKTVVFPNVCLFIGCVCVFKREISRSLAQTGKTARKGRPSLLAIESDLKIKYPVAVRPDDLARKDGYAHWPIHATKGRCRNCKTGTTRLKNIKCDARFCLTETKNCFFDFHN
nr:unnamed protein product [Callosobruchus analis]